MWFTTTFFHAVAYVFLVHILAEANFQSTLTFAMKINNINQIYNKNVDSKFCNLKVDDKDTKMT